MKQLEVEKFAAAMAQLDSHFKTKKYLIACSGGLDSTVLIHLSQHLDLNFSIAHVNYKLRDESSEKDAEFCKLLASKYQKPFFLKEVETKLLKKSGESVQMLCRQIRYDFFKELQSEFSYDYILTAHHADDDNETFFLNLVKGKGIKSLSGIKPKNSNILHPLLGFHKSSILDYAKSNNLKWREDQSNLESKYDRNFFRNIVIPLIEERNPEAGKNIKKSIDYLKQASEYLDAKLESEKKEIFTDFENGFKIEISKLNELSDFQLHHFFEEYGMGKPKEVRKIINGRTGAKLVSSSRQLFKDRDFLCLMPLENSDSEQNEIVLSDFPYTSEHPFPIKLEISKSANPDAEFSWDADKIEFPLKLRTRKPGDVFYPSGFSGSKKISKFFKDEKIPNFEKDKIWLLTDAKNRILSVIPLRADRRFAVNSSTQNYLNLFV